MKRLFAIIFLTLIMLTAFSCGRKGDSDVTVNNINHQKQLITSLNALSVYKNGENYLIIVENGDNQKLAEFSPDRICKCYKGIKPISDADVYQFLNIDFEQVTEKYGQPHVDVGSGFCIPAYVTENANLICLEVENGIVVGVIKRDLFTNQIVDRADKIQNEICLTSEN